MSRTEIGDLDLRQPGYKWLIGDNADTTQGSTNCAYDRLGVTSDTLLSSDNEIDDYAFDVEN